MSSRPFALNEIFKKMPSFRSFLPVRWIGLLRDWALRCWRYPIVLAVCSISLAEARPFSHQERTGEPTAVWTWQTVSGGFFSEAAHGRSRGTGN